MSLCWDRKGGTTRLKIGARPLYKKATRLIQWTTRVDGGQKAWTAKPLGTSILQRGRETNVVEKCGCSALLPGPDYSVEREKEEKKIE